MGARIIRHAVSPTGLLPHAALLRVLAAGDPRGTTDRAHNTFGDPHIPRDDMRRRYAADHAKQPEIVFDTRDGSKLYIGTDSELATTVDYTLNRKTESLVGWTASPCRGVVRSR